MDIDTERIFHRFIWYNIVSDAGNQKVIFSRESFLILCLFNQMTKTEAIEIYVLIICEVAPLSDS